MSMIGEYARVTPSQLDRALRDPQWAYEHVQALIEEDVPLGDVGPCTDLDKAWGGIGFLLAAHGPSKVDVIAGGTYLDEDWGYGPARYLTAAEVSEASRYLLETPFDRLAGHYDAARMKAEDVYPAAIWDDDAGTVAYLKEYYEVLVEFFETAASSGEAVLLWLD